MKLKQERKKGLAVHSKLNAGLNCYTARNWAALDKCNDEHGFRALIGIDKDQNNNEWVRCMHSC